MGGGRRRGVVEGVWRPVQGGGGSKGLDIQVLFIRGSTLNQGNGHAQAHPICLSLCCQAFSAKLQGGGTAAIEATPSNKCGHPLGWIVIVIGAMDGWIAIVIDS